MLFVGHRKLVILALFALLGNQAVGAAGDSFFQVLTWDRDVEQISISFPFRRDLNPIRFNEETFLQIRDHLVSSPESVGLAGLVQIMKRLIRLRDPLLSDVASIYVPTDEAAATILSLRSNQHQEVSLSLGEFAKVFSEEMYKLENKILDRSLLDVLKTLLTDSSGTEPDSFLFGSEPIFDSNTLNKLKALAKQGKIVFFEDVFNELKSELTKLRDIAEDLYKYPDAITRRVSFIEFVKIVDRISHEMPLIRYHSGARALEVKVNLHENPLLRLVDDRSSTFTHLARNAGLPFIKGKDHCDVLAGCGSASAAGVAELLHTTIKIDLMKKYFGDLFTIPTPDFIEGSLSRYADEVEGLLEEVFTTIFSAIFHKGAQNGNRRIEFAIEGKNKTFEFNSPHLGPQLFERLKTEDTYYQFDLSLVRFAVKDREGGGAIGPVTLANFFRDGDLRLSLEINDFEILLKELRDLYLAALPRKQDHPVVRVWDNFLRRCAQIFVGTNKSTMTQQ